MGCLRPLLTFLFVGDDGIFIGHLLAISLARRGYDIAAAPSAL